jgi:hypothetical protein
MGSDKLFLNYPDIFEHYLDKVSNLIVIVLDSNKMILNCNQGFLRFLNLAEKPVKKGLQEFIRMEKGESLAFPPPLSVKPPLRGASFGLVTFKNMEIPFLDPRSNRLPLNCHVVNLGQHYLLIGEKEATALSGRGTVSP